MPSEPADHILTLRPLGQADVGWTAALHEAVLPAGLFPELGETFLSEYHRAFILSPYAESLVILSNSQPCGFAMGATDPRAHRRWIIQTRRAPLLRAGLVAFARRPDVLARFVRTRGGRYLRRLTRAKGGETGAPSTCGELSHLAVEPEFRRRGIGRALVEALTSSLVARGVTTVRTQTSGADDFYRELGWVETAAGVDADGTAFRIYSFSNVGHGANASECDAVTVRATWSHVEEAG
jgi:ribosomal protein S18 acetylase RimI-like enzyme